MFKRLVLILAIVLLSHPVYAATVNDTVSSNFVSYNTAGLVVTFDTVVDDILVSNESTTAYLYVQFKGLGWNTDKTTYSLPTLTTGFRVEPSSSITLDLAIDKLGFITDSGSGTVNYLVTGSDIQP